MTNLTDEGLRQQSIDLIREICELTREDAFVIPFEERIAMISHALQQIRDAAKNETVERCAKVAEQHTSTDGACDLSNANVEGYRTAVSQIVTAIRQMGGGK